MNIIAKLRKTYLFSRLIPESMGITHAKVEYEKLEKWIDTQYRPFFTSTQDQLLTNAEQLRTVISQFDPLIVELQAIDFAQSKIHLRKTADDHRQQLIEHVETLKQISHKESANLVPIQEFYDLVFDRLSQLSDLYKKSQDTLGLANADLFEKFIAIQKQLNQNYMLAADILDNSVNASYVSMRSLAKKILTKKAHVQEIHNQIMEYKSNIQLIEKEMQKITTKIATIEIDPRYQSELQSSHKMETRYRQSFYELDLLDLQSKQRQLESKKQDAYDQILHKEQEISTTNLDADLHILKSNIKKQLSVAIELP